MKARPNQKEFPWLNIDDYFSFPPPESAKKNGIVAHGGNLSPGMLRSAYIQGIFPWFNPEDPILWWSPSPRFVLFPNELHIPARLERFLKNSPFTFTADAAFGEIISSCAQARRAGQRGTWISAEMIDAFTEFHRLGYAHSFEAWHGEKLAGGFYGILIGRMFFGESMFTRVPDASKAAFCRFVKIFENCGGALIDSQVYTDHIARFGGKNISREVFLRLEREYLNQHLKKDLIREFSSGFMVL